MKTIVFRVNLETPSLRSHSHPVSMTDSATNFKSTRSIFLPDHFRGNHALKHGDQFTVTGKNAQYLKDLYCLGTPDDLLTVVSEEL